jgi:hypothetical protein
VTEHLLDRSSGTFSYVRYNEPSAALQAEFKVAFESLERMALSLPAGRARALVMTKLEEAYMWVGKAIRDQQVASDPTTLEQPERKSD